MQRMHQSYKCMKAQQKKLSGCASNLLAHEDLGHLRKPIIRIYKPSSIMKNSHQYMKVRTQETLYHEDHGATLKHKCGKRIVALSFSFFLSYFFIWAFLSFLWPLFFLFFFVRSLIPTCGGIIVSIILSSLGQCSNNDDHHTSIDYNIRITTQILEQDMTLYECLRRCTGMCNDLAQQ